MLRAVFILLLFALAPVAAGAGQPLVLNTCHLPPYHYPDQSGLNDRLVETIFARLGLQVTTQLLPPERALINANDGIDDGDAGRVDGIAAQYPNLIQIPEPLLRGDLVAVTKNISLETVDWQALQPYNIVIVQGHKGAEAGIGTPRSLLKVKSLDLLLQMIADDKAEVAICERFTCLGMLSILKLQGIRVLEPALASVDTYLYLHKKHAALVPELAAALRAMKSDGSYDRIVAEFTEQYGPVQRRAGK
ncbi:MAG: hypothetical protein A2521_08845 [Deltaproteobacteria bacterium RIFOXYD12_FULL_57_12]|nr:MAG: hypothetical protein A2521_08845 [Deltaproteobacteria bacterium RIFOXYD12_FULL_57_12]